jgi:uncharacterized membrane protein
MQDVSTRIRHIILLAATSSFYGFLVLLIIILPWEIYPKHPMQYAQQNSGAMASLEQARDLLLHPRL